MLHDRPLPDGVSCGRRMKLVREENLGERSVIGKELVPDVNPDHARTINKVLQQGVYFCVAPTILADACRRLQTAGHASPGAPSICRPTPRLCRPQRAAFRLRPPLARQRTEALLLFQDCRTAPSGGASAFPENCPPPYRRLFRRAGQCDPGQPSRLTRQAIAQMQTRYV